MGYASRCVGCAVKLCVGGSDGWLVAWAFGESVASPFHSVVTTL